jgi:oxygen-independent coproporphyrinogen-3 oxidase
VAGIYLHIPFCKQACYYCDFHFSTNTRLKTELVQSLQREAVLRRSYLPDELVSSVYFGGGTPSLLDQAELQALLDTLRQTYTIAADAEITLEANPDDLNEAKLAELAEAGINRLSIGIQSFDADQLRFLHRAHTAEQARSCVANARQAGFTNLSLDLIYAIPAENHRLWEENLAKIAELQPEHISAYSLTIEPDTVFGNWQKKGRLFPASDDWAAEQFELLRTHLSKAGYEQYEVSNFCRPGYYSRHNSSYWLGKPYLGLGPSAHSFNGTSRQFNVAHNARYIQALSEDRIPFSREELSPADRINEYLLTGLRTSWGCDLGFLKNSLGYDLYALQGPYLERLFAARQAEIVDQRLRLTARGLLLADEITLHLMADSGETAY